jgi:hypothetical protein
MIDRRNQDHNVRRLRRPVRSSLDRRWTAGWYAELRTQSHPLGCWVLDVSADGAKLYVGYGASIVGDGLSLILPNFTAIPVRLAWRHRDRVGVQFCASQPWIVELVALAAKAEDGLPTLIG